MALALDTLLKHKAINEWRLLALISLPISLIMITAILRTDAWNAAAVSSMIQLSVRWSVPWLYLAFSASSLQLLLPGRVSRWLLRNRKIFGLCFAAAMAWQLLFILYLVTVYSDYYIDEVYVLRDAIEGVIGYLFLIAMTITSFKFARKKLPAKTWRLLHKTGIYFLWAYAFSVYWWALYYYLEPDCIDYLYYGAGFLAWGLRAAAWRKKSWKQAQRATPGATRRPLCTGLGSVLIAGGIVAACAGSLWAGPAIELLSGYTLAYYPEKYLPYWPFEPFLPLFIIALGVYLTVRPRMP